VEAADGQIVTFWPLSEVFAYVPPADSRSDTLDGPRASPYFGASRYFACKYRETGRSWAHLQTGFPQRSRISAADRKGQMTERLAISAIASCS
jgi:hypothetical protein